jgi:hypothetical protein
VETRERGSGERESGGAGSGERAQEGRMQFGRWVIGLAMAVVLVPLAFHAQLFSMTREQLIADTAQNPFDRFPDGRTRCPMR